MTEDTFTEQDRLCLDIDLRLIDLWQQWDEVCGETALVLTEAQEAVVAAAFRLAYWQGRKDMESYVFEGQDLLYGDVETPIP